MKSPAFQFYAAEYLADENVQIMTLEEEGIYIRLLAFCWREGSIPEDENTLSMLCKGGSTTLIARVKKRFIPSEEKPGRMIHARLEMERRKQEKWREKSRLGGQKTQEKRNPTEKKPSIKGGSTTPSRVVQPEPRKGGSALQSSSSSSINTPLPPEGDEEEGGWVGKEHRDFSAWFSLYPKQIGEIEAQREWMACSHQRPPLAEMIDRLTSHINSQEWQADEGKFIPRAAAYINGQRWRDKLTPGRKMRAPKKTPETPPEVDDNAALRWLRENYDHCEMESTDTYCKPFRDWPELARKEYLKHQTKQIT
jgi:uncharacterized protein YdaU (DUF1376 family)